MTSVEKNLIAEYFCMYEVRLEDNVKEFDIRACRRRLDSIDHLEEIIAKERLIMFESIRDDILTILNMEYVVKDKKKYTLKTLAEIVNDTYKE